MGKFRKLLEKDWLKYGFETFAVLVGVLGAFALENWRDNLKDRQTEKEYIQNLISDINRQKSIIDEQADFEKSMRSTILLMIRRELRNLLPPFHAKPSLSTIRFSRI